MNNKSEQLLIDMARSIIEAQTANESARAGTDGMTECHNLFKDSSSITDQRSLTVKAVRQLNDVAALKQSVLDRIEGIGHPVDAVELTKALIIELCRQIINRYLCDSQVNQQVNLAIGGRLVAIDPQALSLRASLDRLQAILFEILNSTNGAEAYASVKLLLDQNIHNYDTPGLAYDIMEFLVKFDDNSPSRLNAIAIIDATIKQCNDIYWPELTKDDFLVELSASSLYNYHGDTPE